MQIHVGGRVAVDGLQEPQELLMPVPALGLPDHLAGRHVQRGEQARGAVPDVVVGLPCGAPGIIGSTGAVRSSACIWLFSSTASTMAPSGGSRYSPTMSRTFSMNCGSVDSFQSSTRCGLSPKARQIRETAVWLSPHAWPSSASTSEYPCWRRLFQASPPRPARPRRRSISVARPAAARPTAPPAAGPRTAIATYPPCPATPRAAPPPACSASRPRTPARSAPASPAPATTSPAASTAPTSAARRPTTPTISAPYLASTNCRRINDSGH